MNKIEIKTMKLLEEVTDKNQAAIELVDNYLKVADLIERTYLAMGKKSTFKVCTSSTVNEKLNTNVYASTH